MVVETTAGPRRHNRKRTASHCSEATTDDIIAQHILLLVVGTSANAVMTDHSMLTPFVPRYVHG